MKERSCMVIIERQDPPRGGMKSGECSRLSRRGMSSNVRVVLSSGWWDGVRQSLLYEFGGIASDFLSEREWRIKYVFSGSKAGNRAASCRV